MEDRDHLTPRQRQYVHHLARGMDSRAAALKACYSLSFAKVAAHRLGKKPAVAAAIEAIRAEGRKVAVYDLATAMAEAEAVCAFAKKNRNAMAYCKATELRAKLSGLLIDRVEIAHVDLTAALSRAEQRVLQSIGTNNGLAKGSIRWGAQIPGAQVADNSEAGAVDGESGCQVKNVEPTN